MTDRARILLGQWLCNVAVYLVAWIVLEATGTDVDLAVMLVVAGIVTAIVAIDHWTQRRLEQRRPTMMDRR